MKKLVESPELALEMGEKGIERVKQFTWKSFVKLFDEIIKDVGELAPKLYVAS